MTKDEATARLAELGGDSRKGEGLFNCKLMELKSLRLQETVKENKLISKGIIWSTIKCDRECSHYEPAVMYLHETQTKQAKHEVWEVEYPRCKWGSW